MTVRRLLAVVHPFSGFVLGLILVGCLVQPAVSFGETQEEFNIKGRGVKKENLFNIFFGHVPMMSTQRGTVIIEAFHDKNNNQRRDDGEETLEKVITCILDEVEYSIPAFIPGLDNGMNYTILFQGTRFQPTIGQKEVFIKKRGQIIRIDLPCRDDSAENSLASKIEPEPSNAVP